MKNRLIIVISLFLWGHQALSMDAYKNCFTADIYDQSWSSKATSANEKENELQRRKLVAIKAPLLDPLDDELRGIFNDGAKKAWSEWGVLMVNNIVVICDPSGISGLYWGGYLMYSCYWLGNLEKHQDAKCLANKNKKDELIADLSSGVRAQLEKIYVHKKSKLSKAWQDRIEGFLLDSYDSGTNHSAALINLIGFPSTIRTGYKDNYDDELEQALDLLEALLGNKDNNCEMALSSVAEASLNALSKDKPGRRAIYFEDQSGQAGFMLKSIAKALQLRYFVVDAKKEPVLSREFLYGKYGEKRGLLMEPFSSAPYLNPILIILNIDE